MSTQTHIITAEAIAPVNPALPPILTNAGVTISGNTIIDIGTSQALEARHPHASRQHHTGLLLPGFVNAHTHLELSYLNAAKLAAPHFAQWVNHLFASYPRPEDLDRVVRAATIEGARQSLRHGVTSIGDISRNISITRPILVEAAAVPRVTSFGEIVGLGKRRDRMAALLDAAANKAHETNLLRTAVSPHAPYTVEGPSLRRIVDHAVAHKLPIAMHLAELAEETQFLRDLSGALGREWDLMQKMDILDDRIPLHPGGPIQWAHTHGLLEASHHVPVLLAHVNYASDADIALLAQHQPSVIYCPRTHEYFGHRPHRYRDMLHAGINVALGTDSLASNPDLNILREAQLLVRRDQLEPYTALEMITRRGAQALGLRAGMLAPKMLADLVLMPPPPIAADPIQWLLEETPEPQGVWLNGARIF